jgi:hypothetical protein
MAQKHKPKLTPRQRARRRDNRNPLYDPAAQISGHDLRRAANALTRAEVAPQVAAIKGQRRDVTQQGKALLDRTTSYYTSLAEQQANAIAQQRALQERVGQQVQAASDQSKAAVDQASQDASTAVSRAQSLTGVDAGQQARVAQEGAAAKSNQALQAGAAASNAALTAQNYGGLSGIAGQAAQLHGAESTRQLASGVSSARQKLTQQLADVRSTKGALNLKNLLTLRQQGFENRATVAGLGLKEADLQSQAQKDAADRKLAEKRLKQTGKQNKRSARLQRRAQNITARGQDKSSATQRRSQDLSHADRVAARQAAANKKPPKKPETQSSKNLKGEIDDARSEIRRQRAAGKHGPDITKSGRKNGVKPVVLNAARDLEYLGYISGPNLAALRRRGVKIPKNWLHDNSKRARRTRRVVGNFVG